LDDESASQAAQRILKEISGVYGSYKLYITSDNPLSTPPEEMSTISEEVSTSNTPSVTSTNFVDTVDTQIAVKLDPVLERLEALEERLGKLRA
jgi:hypothetical protein